VTEKLFEDCEICGAAHWEIIRCGSIRDGAFGRFTGPDAVVGRCEDCGVERLAELFCHDDSIYTTTKYRSLLEEGHDSTSFFEQHDNLQLQNLSVLWPESLRDRIVADIGCAAGSFLDHVAGLAKETIAIEPCQTYHESLRQRGHMVFPTITAATVTAGKKIDFAFSFSVIEHVGNPREFLAEIAMMLAPRSHLLVSTPNRRDALMDLLPVEYPAFHYRTVHRWYFDVDSFTRCAELAGLRVTKSRCVHRFGLSNALIWLRDRRPGGRNPLAHLDSSMLDRFWQSYLEQKGVGDYLYFWLSRAD
jgi:2-polyprenyl-3-methyl-5-hydroxy-6-metoxy-1,4-benzoquinol methylase